MTDDAIRSVHKLRRVARTYERQLQQIIDDNDPDRRKAHGIPIWARGVKVQRAGFFQHAIVYTKNRGH